MNRNKMILGAWVLGLLFPIEMMAKTSCIDNSTRLWYNAPAQHWLEALPIGNSHLGGMVYGGTTDENIQLNEETFWSGGPHNNNSKKSLENLPKVRELIFNGREEEAAALINQTFIPGPHGMRFLPMANLHITMKNQGKAEQFVRDLDLKRAIATTSFVMDGVRYTRTIFASLADGVIVCHIKASRKGALNIDVTLDSPFEHQTQKTPSGVMLKVKGQDQEGIKAALAAECVADVRTDGTEATIIVSAATNFVNYHDVSGNAAQRNADYINKVKLMSYAQLEKRHVEAYQKQFATSSLILPTDINASLPTNQRLEKFAGSKDMAMVALMYNYGRYLLISSSQPGGQAANLQGVWNNSKNAPWDSKYTININTEMNYWPAEVTNLANTTERRSGDAARPRWWSESSPSSVCHSSSPYPPQSRHGHEVPLRFPCSRHQAMPARDARLHHDSAGASLRCRLLLRSCRLSGKVDGHRRDSDRFCPQDTPLPAHQMATDEAYY
jgi:alpha-L-fucosidase 2